MLAWLFLVTKLQYNHNFIEPYRSGGRLVTNNLASIALDNWIFIQNHHFAALLVQKIKTHARSSK
jgi:hypothetical protein